MVLNCDSFSFISIYWKVILDLVLFSSLPFTTNHTMLKKLFTISVWYPLIFGPFSKMSSCYEHYILWPMWFTALQSDEMSLVPNEWLPSRLYIFILASHLAHLWTIYSQCLMNMMASISSLLYDCLEIPWFISKIMRNEHIFV